MKPNGNASPFSQSSALARYEITKEAAGYPKELFDVERPPDTLYIAGNPSTVAGGLAVIGARRATPYGLACAEHFASLAASQGICIVSGGAYGCDSRAHRAALEAGGTTVAVLGGGVDRPYPSSHAKLFQDVLDAGGALVSEHPWDREPRPYAFRERNRLIAGLAKAVLIVEAGLPSGTFSTADFALASGREVLVIPGCITSPSSLGSNRLLFQGATPIVDDASFSVAMTSIYGVLVGAQDPCDTTALLDKEPILAALYASPMRLEEISTSVKTGMIKSRASEEEIMCLLTEWEAKRLVARFPDGRYGPASL